MAVNFVKFVRGTPQAFKVAIKNKDTLYFIAEQDAEKGELYLGEKLISGGEVALADLTDVLIDSLKDGQLLVYSASEQTWKNKSVIEAISIMKGPTDSSQGSAGLVPPPGIKQQDYFLKGDGTWGLPEVNPEVIKELEERIAKIASGIKDKVDVDKVYTKEEVNTLISSVNGLKRKKISSLQEIELDHPQSESFIYILPVEGEEVNSYDEYLVVDGKIEKIGSSKVNLEGYVTSQALQDALSGYVESKEDYDLVKQSEINKLASVEEGAEPNYVKSTSEEFLVDEAGQLNINTISSSKIDGIDELLDGKVDKKSSVYEGEEVEWSLLSPENQKKLSSLVIGDNDNLEISGKVNADNVEGLSEWISENRDKTEGLYPSEDEEKLAKIEDGAQKNFICSVDPKQMTVNQDGLLSIVSLSAEVVKDLNQVQLFSSLSKDFTVEKKGSEKILSLSSSVVRTSLYLAEVGDLAQLRRQAGQNSTIVDEINYINDRLKWQELNL